LFDRFYQVENSLRREHGGIGLGLAIAREMADLIDGRLWVESTPGVGSTFYLALPLERQ
jgi:two-component system sensor histidine kinase VicK